MNIHALTRGVLYYILEENFIFLVKSKPCNTIYQLQLDFLNDTFLQILADF